MCVCVCRAAGAGLYGGYGSSVLGVVAVCTERHAARVSGGSQHHTGGHRMQAPLWVDLRGGRGVLRVWFRRGRRQKDHASSGAEGSADAEDARTGATGFSFSVGSALVGRVGARPMGRSTSRCSLRSNSLRVIVWSCLSN